MAKRRKKSKAKGIATAVVVLIAVIAGLFFGKDAIFGGLSDDPSAPVSGGEVQFHFIDVGQGDAALIRTEKGDILIDAGTNSSEDELKAYLDSLGVTDIEYAVFTHPHEDHIGGADMVLDTYNVKNVVLPDATSTSKTFERMMDAIEAEKCGVIEATPEKTFKVGELTCTILAPIGTSYTETNDYSVVIRADYGETSVLFTGDAEIHSEEEMLERYRFKGLLDCDLLKVGHHGSDTSSGQAFLDAVTPVYAVISCGEGNSYGHPIQAILARYEAMKAEIYRTDLEGSIVFTSTGGEPTKK
ncbi:MAG: MBL fold metallo-hydrolase [Clostridia bacterium]|nr:MBL fold metallo-hydrolase [Clostridia bacterium]